MVTVQVRSKLIDINKIRRNMIRVLGKMRHDVRMLGEGGYKHLKRLIPVGKLNKPHLRDSFKIKTEMVPRGVKLTIYTDVFYAPFVDAGVSVPMRFPKRKSVMHFEDNGVEIFTKKAKGFRIKGIHYVANTEAWLLKNARDYVDFSLGKYLR